MQSKTTTVFAQLCNMLPREALINLANEKIIVTDGRQVNAQKYNVWDLLCALIFCHLGRCTSLCGIEDGLLTAQKELHHARQARYLKRSTLSYVNSRVGFRILESYYYLLLRHFRSSLGIRFSETYSKPVFSLDSTTITVCCTLFPWARYRTHKGGFKLHTALSHDLMLPQVVVMTDGKVADVKQAKAAIKALPADSFVVMDRGYNDYELFSWLTDRGTSFVTRLKDNALTTKLAERCVESVPDQWGVYEFEFTGIAASTCRGMTFRLVQWHDTENERWFDFITNNSLLTGPQVADLYRNRWKVELFFKKLKQNLNVKHFIGRTENAVMNQVWGAMIATLLVAVLRRQAAFKWRFSRLFEFLSMNLLTHNDLWAMIDRPGLDERDEQTGGNLSQEELF